MAVSDDTFRGSPAGSQDQDQVFGAGSRKVVDRRPLSADIRVSQADS